MAKCGKWIYVAYAKCINIPRGRERKGKLNLLWAAVGENILGENCKLY